MVAAGTEAAGTETGAAGTEAAEAATATPAEVCARRSSSLTSSYLFFQATAAVEAVGTATVSFFSLLLPLLH